MPPNLGGFFMVRSYYPSECHADYFDFERIEALKPAIEACGISTLSQSPMLGFHKQMDNRIKLLEEILSFRMQGVEFDNGDMYVDGHKAASDVRDEFVSVTEKLMDELAQCYNVLPQLDINNTIDHRPEGDEKWFLENEKTVTQFCRKLAAERPLKDIRDEYNYPKKKGIKDECSRLLEASTMKSRRGFAIQRLMNAMRQAHADGWFIVFDTLTLADDRLEAFYDNPNALRDYFRDIGRMVLAAEGRREALPIVGFDRDLRTRRAHRADADTLAHLRARLRGSTEQERVELRPHDPVAHRLVPGSLVLATVDRDGDRGEGLDRVRIGVGLELEVGERPARHPARAQLDARKRGGVEGEHAEPRPSDPPRDGAATRPGADHEHVVRHGRSSEPSTASRAPSGSRSCSSRLAAAATAKRSPSKSTSPAMNASPKRSDVGRRSRRRKARRE